MRGPGVALHAAVKQAVVALNSPEDAAASAAVARRAIDMQDWMWECVMLWECVMHMKPAG